MVTQTSTEFINVAPQDTDEAIRNVLGAVWELAAVDEGHLYRIHGQRPRKFILAHVRNSDGDRTPALGEFQHLPVNLLRCLRSRLGLAQPVHIPSVADQPAKAPLLKSILGAVAHTLP